MPKDKQEYTNYEKLFKDLIALGAPERDGKFRVILDYDNYHDGARVLDGAGNVLAECYDTFSGLLDEDPEALTQAQFARAIEKAAQKSLDPARLKWVEDATDLLCVRFGRNPQAPLDRKRYIPAAKQLATEFFDGMTVEGRYSPEEAIDLAYTIRPPEPTEAASEKI